MLGKERIMRKEGLDVIAAGERISFIQGGIDFIE